MLKRPCAPPHRDNATAKRQPAHTKPTPKRAPVLAKTMPATYVCCASHDGAVVVVDPVGRRLTAQRGGAAVAAAIAAASNGVDSLAGTDRRPAVTADVISALSEHTMDAAQDEQRDGGRPYECVAEAHGLIPYPARTATSCPGSVPIVACVTRTAFWTHFIHTQRHPHCHWFSGSAAMAASSIANRIAPTLRRSAVART